MTHTRLRECCDILGWGAGTLARHTEVNPTTAKRWLGGKVPIPDQVATALETITAAALTLSRKPD